ncbi:hypothetical protein SLS62_003889 [Diatrype stigma]|uniref:Homeodomain-like protein n=1 Tax=Diatrype stigma TaxID=117547 RepID=A0AAN9URK5_9PEZI
MDLDDDYALGSPGGSSEMDSSEGSHQHQQQQGPQQGPEHEFQLPMRPVSPGAENQQADAGPSAAVPVANPTTVMRTSRKRRRSEYSIPGADPAGQPLKRHRGFFTQTYVDLYNQDVMEMRRRLNALTKAAAPGSLKTDLLPSQVGAVTWQAVEKEHFFCALERAGRLDTAEIARRVRTKSELEVQQYLTLLREELRARRAEAGADPREIGVSIADVPAAADVSQDVCASLEVFADELTLREQQHEDKCEAKRWGGAWLITPALATFLDREVRENFRRRNYPYLHHPDLSPANAPTNISRALAGEGPIYRQQQLQYQQQQQYQRKAPPFAELLHVHNWLQLSERVFMNSAVPDLSWQFFSEEPPSMRATAFQDFGALVESVTRRLVAAALHAASSRIRAKLEGGDRRTRPLVKAKDVRAAAAASLARNAAGNGRGEIHARGFWARSARRLKLNVYRDDESDDDHDGDDDADDDDHGDDDDVEKEEDESDEETAGFADIRTQDEQFSNIRDASGYSNDEKADHESEDEVDFMSYNEVEKALGYRADDSTESSDGETESDVYKEDDGDDDNYLLSSDGDDDLAGATSEGPTSEDPITNEDGDPVDADTDAEDNDEADEAPLSELYKHHTSLRVNQDEVDRDFHEAIEWAGPAYTNLFTGGAATTRARQALRRRIEKEHWLEAFVESADASRSMEAQEWLEEAVLDAGGATAARGGSGSGRGSGDKVTHRIEADIRRQKREKEARRERLREESRRAAAAAAKNGLQQQQEQGPEQHWDERVAYRAEWEEERQRRAGG